MKYMKNKTKTIDNKKEKEIIEEGGEINKIYHISDIHINKYDNRHEEYRCIFEKMYEEIRKDKEGGVIVITGDTVNDKHELYPNQIMILKEMLIKLSEIMDIIIILGNHDITPHINTMDAISPIIRGLKTENKIHLLLEDKIYEYKNILFGLTTMGAERVMECKREKGKINIGLYHGIVRSDKMNIVYGEQGRFDIKEFKEYYDIVLLGDIHRFFYLDEEKTTAYASSLIQQNYGEEINRHGILKWYIPSLRSEYIELRNEYGMIKIYANKGGIKGYEKKEIPKYGKIQIHCDNITNIEINKIIEDIKREHKEVTCIYVRDNIELDMKMTINTKDREYNISEIKDDTTVQSIINDYMEQNCEYSEEIKKGVNKKVGEILKGIRYKWEIGVRKFRLIEMEFDNFFVYGEKNRIDYTKMKDITGLIGENHSGKSTIIDIMLYAIYGKCTRGNKFDIINIKKNMTSTKIIFMINNERYEIQRIRCRNIGKIIKNNTTETIRIMKEGKNISGHDLVTNNNMITEMICKYEDFIMFTVILQKNPICFIDLTDQQRKQILYKMLQLEIFDKLGYEAKEISKNNNLYINKIIGKEEKGMINEEKREIQKKIEENEGEIEKMRGRNEEKEKEYNEIKKRKIQNEYKIEEYEKNNKKENNKITRERIKEMNNNIIRNKREIEERENEIKNKYKEKEIIRRRIEKYKGREIKEEKIEEIKRLQEEYIKIIKDKVEIGEWEDDERERIIKEIDENNIIEQDKEIIERYKIYKRRKERYEILKREKEEIEKKREENINRIETMKGYEYDEECKYCMKNRTTIEKRGYEKERERNEKEIYELEEKMKNIKINKYEEIEKKYNEYNKIEEENKRKEKEKEENEKKIEIIDKRIKDRERNKKIDEESDGIMTKIRKEMNSEMIEYDEYNKRRERMIELMNKINEEEKEITNMKDKLIKEENEMIELRREEKEYNEYMKTKEENEGIKKEYIRIGKEIEEMNNKREKMKQNEIRYKTLIEKEEERIEQYNKLTNEKEITDIIFKLIDKNGVVDNMINKTVIPTLERNINSILKLITDYEIKFEYTGNGINIYKIHNNEKINIETLSGCEALIANITFRLAFTKLNNYIDIGFLYIDEAFSYMDNQYIKKLENIFNYIRRNYEWVIMMSHDERVIKLYDNKIMIYKTEDGSKIYN